MNEPLPVDRQKFIAKETLAKHLVEFMLARLPLERRRKRLERQPQPWADVNLIAAVNAAVPFLMADEDFRYALTMQSIEDQ